MKLKVVKEGFGKKRDRLLSLQGISFLSLAEFPKFYVRFEEWKLTPRFGRTIFIPRTGLKGVVSVRFYMTPKNWLEVTFINFERASRRFRGVKLLKETFYTDNLVQKSKWVNSDLAIFVQFEMSQFKEKKKHVAVGPHDPTVTLRRNFFLNHYE